MARWHGRCELFRIIFAVAAKREVGAPCVIDADQVITLIGRPRDVDPLYLEHAFRLMWEIACVPNDSEARLGRPYGAARTTEITSAPAPFRGSINADPEGPRRAVHQQGNVGGV